MKSKEAEEEAAVEELNKKMNSRAHISLGGGCFFGYVWALALVT